MKNSHAENTDWIFKKRQMEQHWRRVILSKPRIDDSTPFDYIKSNKVKEMKRKEKQYSLEDKKRHERIDLICKRTDQLSPQVLAGQVKFIRQSRFSQMKTKIRVKLENKTFFNRVKNTTPIYSIQDMKEHERTHLSRMRYLKDSKFEDNDYGRGSRNYGLVSTYGKMKLNYYDTIPYYKTVNKTMDFKEIDYSYDRNSNETSRNSLNKTKYFTNIDLKDTMTNNKRADDFSNYNIFMKKKRKDLKENKDLQRNLDNNINTFDNSAINLDKAIDINKYKTQEFENKDVIAMEKFDEHDNQICNSKRSIQSKKTYKIRKSFEQSETVKDFENKNVNTNSGINIKKKVRKIRPRKDGK